MGGTCAYYVFFFNFSGEGIGKDGNRGIRTAIKPNYKTGKEGVGFDLSKELTDTWWTRAYSDSLNRVTVATASEDDPTGEVKVSFNDDDDDGTGRTNEMAKMRKRMLKSNFTDFSKVRTRTVFLNCEKC